MNSVYGLDLSYPKGLGEILGWLLAFAFATLLVRAVYTAIYNVYIHPLKNYPGPWLAKVTPLPLVWRTINGRMVHWTKHQHKMYGDVVRLAPDELSFINSSAWADIQTARPELSKPAKGTIVSVNGIRPLPHITKTEDHTRQRRILNHAFSDRALREQEYILQGYGDLLVRQLREKVKTGVGIDLSYWYQLTTIDIIGDLCFGKSFLGLEKGEHHPWVATSFKGLKIAQWIAATSYLPPLDVILRQYIPQSIREKAQRNFQFLRGEIDSRIERKTDRPDIMKYVLENNYEEGMTRDEIDSTIQVVIFAGSETSAAAMSAATWFLLNNPDAFRKVKEEIRGAFHRADEITVSSTSRLTYLHAVVQEAMRLHPPSPVALSRYVDRPITIAGSHVPPGVRVGIPQETAYHHNSNFVDPESFVPERWLPEADPIYAADDKASFEPFHVGPRNCIGKNLAWAEIKLILTKVLWNFDIELAKNNVEDWTDQKVWLAHEVHPLNVYLHSTNLP